MAQSIIFRPPLVRAILDGTKTQTRRVASAAQDAFGVWAVNAERLNHRDWAVAWRHNGTRYSVPITSPYDPGDVLYVRETWAQQGGAIVYRATDAAGYDGPWRSPCHMRRADARLWLRITDVWLQRLQAISEQDAIAEGVLREDTGTYTASPGGQRYPRARDAFAALWDSINATRGYGWERNPWVWVVEFERFERAEREELT